MADKSVQLPLLPAHIEATIRNTRTPRRFSAQSIA
jgi:hypothetical protein